MQRQVTFSTTMRKAQRDSLSIGLLVWKWCMGIRVEMKMRRKRFVRG